MSTATRSTCSVAADNDCLDPAGYGTAQGYHDNGSGRTRVECTSCGEKVCANCRYGRRGSYVCLTCVEDAAWRAAGCPA